MLHHARSTLLPLFLASSILTTTLAQWLGPTPTPSNTAINFSNPSGYSTTKYDTFAVPTLIPRPENSTSSPEHNRTIDQKLQALWNQVGPVIPPKSEQPGYVGLSPEVEEPVGPGEFHGLVASRDRNLTSKKLPRGFQWGVASSAYQIEGAAKIDGKGPSIWDLLSHRPPKFVEDNSTGDVVAEHYFQYSKDFRRLKVLGIPAFSPSFSWPRFFPLGRGAVNGDGVKHYDAVISELVELKITPVVTLFHWDTPLALFNEYGAWMDERIVDDFFEYVSIPNPCSALRIDILT